MILRYRLGKKSDPLDTIIIRDIYMISDKFGFIAGTIQKDGKQEIRRLRFHITEVFDY